MTVSQHPLSTSLRTVSALRLALEPVRDTQAIFRKVMDAFSWPGSVQQLPVTAEDAPVNGWAAGLLITLLDHEVALAVEPFEGSDGLEAFVRQRANPGAAAVAAADFIVAHARDLNPQLPKIAKAGSLAYPDDGATIIVLADSLAQDQSAERQLALAGPGVPADTEFGVPEIISDFVEARAEVVRNYPCGIDILLVDREGRLMAWPRSTQITVVKEEGV